MSERFWRQLGDWLEQEPVILASVLAARGATPRRVGSRMLIAAERTGFSIGGGLAEARVIAAARELLRTGEAAGSLIIDLSGRVDSAGICGGEMRIGLCRLAGVSARQQIVELVDRLQQGRRARLPASLSAATGEDWLEPDPRLLICGAGHCGLALYALCRSLDFDLWLQDSRPECFIGGAFAQATCLCGGPELLARAWEQERAVYAVLLSRDFHTDLAVLKAIAERPLGYLGMMGSQRRIAEVGKRLAADGVCLPELRAPVGIEIDAETPAEIAVSIAAELIAVRNQAVSSVPPQHG